VNSLRCVCEDLTHLTPTVGPIMVKLFVSYRRQDSAQVTGRIYDKLVTRFGAQAVFKDVDSIPLGTDFRRILEKSIANCDVVVVVMGLKWAGAMDAQGQPRLSDPCDYVRIEIESALKKNLPVIPLLVDEANMPAAEALPDSMRDLVFRNATKIRPDPDFHRDMDRVIDAIRHHEPMTVIALSEPRKESSHRRRPPPEAEILEVMPVISPPFRPPIAARSRWSRLHNAIAGTVFTGLVGILAAVFARSSVEPSNVGEAIFVYLFMGLVTATPGAIGGAVAKSIWAWVTVLTCTLLFGSLGSIPSSHRGFAEGAAIMAWMGCCLGWFLVIGIAAVRAIIRRMSAPL
jgi:hypothetical protein